MLTEIIIFHSYQFWMEGHKIIWREYHSLDFLNEIKTEHPIEITSITPVMSINLLKTPSQISGALIIKASPTIIRGITTTSTTTNETNKK